MLADIGIEAGTEDSLRDAAVLLDTLATKADTIRFKYWRHYKSIKIPAEVAAAQAADAESAQAADAPPVPPTAEGEGESKAPDAGASPPVPPRPAQ